MLNIYMKTSPFYLDCSVWVFNFKYSIHGSMLKALFYVGLRACPYEYSHHRLEAGSVTLDSIVLGSALFFVPKGIATYFLHRFMVS